MGHMLPWRRSCGPHARIHLHHGKTQVWNRGGTEPSGMEVLTQAAQAVKPGAVVWRGDPLLFPVQQGYEAFVEQFKKSTEQQILFQRIPWVNDPQAVYLLLLLCGATRANSWLRTLRPEDTESTPSGMMRTCGLASDRFSARRSRPLQRTHCPLCLSQQEAGTQRGTSAPRAHWCWADSLRMVRQRHQAIAERMVVGLEVDDPVACFRSVRKQAVLDAGLEIPHWQELADSPLPRSPVNPRPDGNSGPPRSWNRSSCVRRCGQFSVTAPGSGFGTVDCALFCGPRVHCFVAGLGDIPSVHEVVREARFF